MPTIEIATLIRAPVERVFDLARSIDLHSDSTSATGERAVAGVTAGLIGLGQEVTWRARHFGIWQLLTVRVAAFERPVHFADVMLNGAFRRMEHDHYFESSAAGAIMRDVFTYKSPLGILGRVADILFLERYLRSFLIERNRVIKATAESDAWQKYLPAPVEAKAPILGSDRAIHPQVHSWEMTSAISNGDLDRVGALLDAGADLNAKDRHGVTILMLAAGRGGDSRLVRMLLNRGADFHARDNSGRSALGYAFGKRIRETLAELVDEKYEADQRQIEEKAEMERQALFSYVAKSRTISSETCPRCRGSKYQRTGGGGVKRCGLCQGTGTNPDPANPHYR